MRGWSTIAIGFVVACHFDHAAAPLPDAASAAVDPLPPLPCARTRLWAADFSIDPTTLNANGDPVPDWRIRDGGGFPGQLTDGVWSIAGAPVVALDTQPKADFNRRLRATARMRNTSTAGTRGVLLSLNVDYTPMTYMPLALELRLDGDAAHQTATLYGRDATSELVVATFAGLPTELVAVMLDVDPMQNTVTVAVGAESSVYAYAPIPRNKNDDRYATLAAYSDADVDDARIELCE